MSTVGTSPIGLLARRKPSPRIIIARGDNVRAFTIRPWLAGTLVFVGFVFGLLYLLATGYLVFRDDLLAASLSRQGRMQHAYEDRIALLRADIDRLTSRQLLDQQAFDAKMDRLLGRQSALDARQDIIAGLSQSARQAGLVPPLTPSAPAPAADAAAPSPDDSAAPGDTGEAGDSVLPLPPLKPDSAKTSSLMPGPGEAAPIAVALLRTGTNPPPPVDATVRIDSVEKSLDALATEQVAFVEDVGGKIAQRTRKIADILQKLGQDVPPERGDPEEGIGGPFIPLADNADPETFRASVDLITGEIDRYTQIRRLAGQLPLTKPIADASISSGFGVRIDPFFGRPAMHPGIDFMAPMGDSVHATAAGTVISAGYSGGYGNMVEIDHGNGVTTRYGHLSEILVTVGEIVAKGAVIARTGDTGRSTGPHLHYEVRVDGNAINPLRYINAGGELTPYL